LGPLGCPLLEGLEDLSLAFGGPLLPTLTMVVTGVTMLSFGQPHPNVATNPPP